MSEEDGVSKPGARESAGRGAALKFVVFVGILGFFADFTYEGSRSIVGQYFLFLHASAATVAIVSGLGEPLGYGLRLVSGRAADTTGRFWPIAIFGYFVQMISVPLLALAGNRQMAAMLVILERVGKATRNPPLDVMLSHAASRSAAAGHSDCTRLWISSAGFLDLF